MGLEDRLEQRWEPESNLLWGAGTAKEVQSRTSVLETGLFESKRRVVLPV